MGPVAQGDRAHPRDLKFHRCRPVSLMPSPTLKDQAFNSGVPSLLSVSSAALPS